MREKKVLLLLLQGNDARDFLRPHGLQVLQEGHDAAVAGGAVPVAVGRRGEDRRGRTSSSSSAAAAVGGEGSLEAREGEGGGGGGGGRSGHEGGSRIEGT